MSRAGPFLEEGRLKGDGEGPALDIEMISSVLSSKWGVSECF
jgi:hypothetical protein